MDIQSALKVRPQANRIFGVTHSVETGEPNIRTPRSCKIAIGLAGGRDLEVFIDYDDTWVVRSGEKQNRYRSRAEAQKVWPEAVKVAPKRNYPVKLPYFTFVRPSSADYDPDFAVIEAHGPRPTEVPIVFTEPSPLHLAMEMWGSAELKCSGDGRNALRVLQLARTPEEKKLAEQANAAGMDRFPIIDGCSEFGCPFAANHQCKPTSLLKFQLAKMPRLGSSAYFHSTSFRTASNLFSSMEQFRQMSGGHLQGVPLTLSLAQHKVTPEGGKPSIAYNVRLEFRPESATKIFQQFMSAVQEFSGPAAKQIAAAPEPEQIPEAEDSYADIPVDNIANEFFPESSSSVEDPGESLPAEPAVQPEPAGSVEAAEELGRLKARWIAQKTPQDVLERRVARYTQLVVEEQKSASEALLIMSAEEATREEPPAPPPTRRKAAEPVEMAERITQPQWLTLQTLRTDLNMTEADLVHLCRKHGFTGDSSQQLPLKLFRKVVEDLQTPNQPRRKEPAPAQKGFEL